MGAAALGIETSPGTRRNWIIGRGVDLGLVIGGSAAGYLYLALDLLLHVPISLLWRVWSIGFDGTHIFGAAWRVRHDPELRSALRLA